MERAAWIREKQRRCEQRMDTLFAPDYDAHWGHINPTHRAMLERFLAACPAGCVILDAACGTGKYWELIQQSGRSIYGVDQSRGMLDKAHARLPAIPIEKLALQDIPYVERFAGTICMDAMENIFPEDWPHVLANFHRVLTANGHLYFTVELADAGEIHHAFEQGQPVVAGEWAHEGGYHYYPSIEQVREWLHTVPFKILAEASGGGYHHFLTLKR